MTRLRDEDYKAFKKISDKEGVTYNSEVEMKQSADNMFSLVELLIEMERQDRARKKQLEIEPKGYPIEGEGRNCSLCRQMIYDTTGWYDKWGFKCMSCQNAVDKKIIPGSMCGDYDHKKCIADSSFPIHLLSTQDMYL